MKFNEIYTEGFEIALIIAKIWGYKWAVKGNYNGIIIGDDGIYASFYLGNNWEESIELDEEDFELIDINPEAIQFKYQSQKQLLDGVKEQDRLAKEAKERAEKVRQFEKLKKELGYE